MGDFIIHEDDLPPLQINLSINSSSSSFGSISKIRMSPSQRLRYLLASPSRYLQTKFEAGGLNGSILTILASTVGAGILSLPYVVNISGLYQGIVLFILGMVVSLYTCQLLVLSAEKTGKLTYESIGSELFGAKMRTFAEINMIINNYGTVIAYLVLLKDLIPNCLHLFGVTNPILINNYMWGCLICTSIVYPLSLKQEISALRYTSLLSCIACIYLSIAITYGFFDMRSGDTKSRFENAPSAELSAYSLFTASGYVVFSFTCHPNVIPIYQELQKRSTKRGFQFLYRGLLMVLVLYLVVGVFGFLTFYEEYDRITDFPTQILRAKYRKGDVPIIVVKGI
jgi:amino acid permease